MALNLYKVFKILLMSSTVLISYGKAIPCEEARLKCAYREGCGMGLRNYLIGCSRLQTQSNHCPEECQHALIALTSTNEGKELMRCECGDDLCRETKARVEVCRPQVIRATKAETVVTCEIAQWICKADTLCSTAFKYYNANCRSMFAGRKCSPKCRNSIDILRRQEKAAKLDSCVCNGSEESKSRYDCLSIRTNMDNLCFQKNRITISSPPTSTTSLQSLNHPTDIETNELDVQRNSGFVSYNNYPVFVAALLSLRIGILLR